MTEGGTDVTYDAEERARSNARVVRAFLDALVAPDVPRITELLTDDVTYHFPGASPLAGTYRGRDEVLAFSPRLLAQFDTPVTLEIHDVLSSEAHAADFSTYRAGRGGRTFSWRTTRLYHLAKDRISEIYLTIEDQAAFDAFLAEA